MTLKKRHEQCTTNYSGLSSYAPSILGFLSQRTPLVTRSLVNVVSALESDTVESGIQGIL